MAQAARIFVSHNKEDNKWCRKFVKRLRAAGAEVWYDEDNLGYGILMDEIERELHARHIFIPIFSPSAVSSKWVRREVNAFIELQDEQPERIILPVVARKCEVPLLWRGYRRADGPGGSGLTARVAADLVISRLALTPPERPANPEIVGDNETAQEAWERGKGLLAQGRAEQALAAFQRATSLAPNQSHYWISKGYALQKLNRPQEALEAFDHALTLDYE